MLVTYSRQLNSIFERIILDKKGFLVRIRFTVVEINGNFQPVIVSVVSLERDKVEQLYLGLIPSTAVQIDNVNIAKQKSISPFLSLEFFMSQPTRAPSI